MLQITSLTIKNDTPHYGLKEPASVDVQSGFVFAPTQPSASEHDSPYLPYFTIPSCHTEKSIGQVYGDKGYYGHPNLAFLHINGLNDGIMRKEITTVKLTDTEIKRTRRYRRRDIRDMIDQYFGLSHLHGI